MRRNSTGSGFGPLVSADELTALLGAPDVKVLDVRWSLGDPDAGRRAHASGHIPGAVFVDLEGGVTGREGAGRHPLPTRERFEDAVRRAGVNAGDLVVAYDDAGGSVAARLWWLLRAFGHARAAVLDGGIRAWSGPFEKGGRDPGIGDFLAREPDWGSVLTFEQVRSLPADAVLIDVRAPERYRGESEPVDAVAGHVPGARNAFWQATVMAPDGRIAPPGELRRRFEALGVRDDDTVVYCGSGVVACQTLLALEVAGVRGARLYAGGWSDWSSREGAAVATGDD